MALNGQLPASLLADLGDGRFLGVLAASQWKKLQQYARATYGWTPTLSAGRAAYRSLADQVYMLQLNYDHTYRSGATISNGGMRLWDGKVWYRKPGCPTTATPGTSNHGWGNAVDVSGLGGYGTTKFNQFAAAAKRFGFTNTEGASIKEYWHWVYDGETVTPLPEPEEEDDMPYTPDQITDMVIRAFIDMANADESNERDGRESLKNILAPLIDSRIDKVLADTDTLKTRVGGNNTYESLTRYAVETNAPVRNLTGVQKVAQ